MTYPTTRSRPPNAPASDHSNHLPLAGWNRESQDRDASIINGSMNLSRIAHEDVCDAWHKVSAALLRERRDSGFWTGRLSTSALSTATAVSAWSLVRKHKTQEYLRQQATIDAAIDKACHWLLKSQCSDGGFGDTDRSHSNIATSLLVLAAWRLADFGQQAHSAIEKAWAYCDRMGKWDALRKRYGTDKTFVAPILTNCALAGIVPWDDVPTLPFEAAWLPQSWYRLARLPVVSYAVPALVAIGQAKFYHRPPKGPWGYVRRAAIEPTLRVLLRMQPSSGGYLEAAPLTSFVLMCLADIGRGDHPVATRAVRFLLDSRLADGSLPIDTNLATWTTSLSISALAYQPQLNTRQSSLETVATSHSINTADAHTTDRQFTRDESSPLQAISDIDISAKTIRWLLSCQHWSDHPFTGAKPGGWGWTNLSGAVPDADDTPAALLALARWSGNHRGQYPMLDKQIDRAVDQGLKWLLSLQNRDGGWPTFCRGWGKLPFDRSGCDLTAHALRAIQAWNTHNDSELEFPKTTTHFASAVQRGFRFLEKRQNADGSWCPLWFGNQDHPAEENPIYGTAKVLLAYADYRICNEPMQRAVDYLIAHQNADGGWGGGVSVPYRVGPTVDCAGTSADRTATAPDDVGTNAAKEQARSVGSSVEETGWALEALLKIAMQIQQTPANGSAATGYHSTATLNATIMRGLRWLVTATQADCFETSWPIGFYFAKLWYHEQLYPMIAATSALGIAIHHPELWPNHWPESP